MFIFFCSDLEAKDLILNTAQGSPREELLSSPPEKHSPIHHQPPPSRILHPQQKYPPNRPSVQQSSIVSPPASTATDDDYSDSNGGIPYNDYHVFIPTFNEDSYYHHHHHHQQHQEMFYPYSEPEMAGNNLNAANQRPYSASSSTSSSESDNSQVAHAHQGQNLSLQTLGGNQCCGESGHHFMACFNNNQAHVGGQTSMYGFKQLGGHSPNSAGYTSVIVDTQQYQLANEYVH